MALMLRLLNRQLLRTFIGFLNIEKCAIRNQYFNHLANFQNCLLNQKLRIDFQKRYKKKKSKESKIQEQESDEELEASTEDELFTDTFVGKSLEKVIDVPNIRMDVILKSALNYSRKNIEEAFYDMKIRLNGEKTTKKNYEISENDEIDLILGRNKQNIELLDVKRVVVLHIPDLKSVHGRSKVRVRVFHSLTIENYNDPYESMLVREEEEKSN